MRSIHTFFSTPGIRHATWMWLSSCARHGAVCSMLHSDPCGAAALDLRGTLPARGSPPTGNTSFSRLFCLRSPHVLLRSPYVLLRSPYVQLRSPYVLLRSPHVLLRSPHVQLRSPHVLLRSPHVQLGSAQIRCAPCRQGKCAPSSDGDSAADLQDKELCVGCTTPPVWLCRASPMLRCTLCPNKMRAQQRWQTPTSCLVDFVRIVGA